MWCLTQMATMQTGHHNMAAVAIGSTPALSPVSKVYQASSRARYIPISSGGVQSTSWYSGPGCCCDHKQHCGVQAGHAGSRSRVFLAATSSTSRASTTASTSSDIAQQSSKQDWQRLVLQNLDPQQLVKLTLKAKITTKPEQQLARVVSKGAANGNRSPDASPASEAAAAVAAGIMPYKQLTVRPVMLKGKLMLQVSVLNARQDTTKNYSQDQAAEQLQQLLQLPWSSASLQTRSQTTNIQLSRKGKVLMQTVPISGSEQLGRSNSSSSTVPLQMDRNSGLTPVPADAVGAGLITLQHDRVKAQPINGNIADPFLQQIGLQTADGRIKAAMQAKFTQINEFLKLLVHTGELERMGQQAQQQQQQQGTPNGLPGSSSSSSVHILDCGCGSSHLTFGTYHYLSNVRGMPIQLTGIDTNRALMERSNRYCKDLGIEQHACFETAAIRAYQPSQAPDIVLALHACDTATDESLALGIRSGAQVIMSVPCCQKDLHRQQQQSRPAGSADSSSSVELFNPLLSHGILRQRLLDLLTDTFRAHLLRLAGYRTDIVEFVSTEHTPRNLLIRAVKQQRQLPEAEQSRLAAEYVQLKQYWRVTPHLEKLLREDDQLPAALLQQQQQ